MSCRLGTRISLKWRERQVTDCWRVCSRVRIQGPVTALLRRGGTHFCKQHATVRVAPHDEFQKRGGAGIKGDQPPRDLTMMRSWLQWKARPSRTLLQKFNENRACHSCLQYCTCSLGTLLNLMHNWFPRLPFPTPQGQVKQNEGGGGGVFWICGPVWMCTIQAGSAQYLSIPL